ncbi:MAG: hypothetical protein ACKODH_17955 [Limisphaerales bacterium]
MAKPFQSVTPKCDVPGELARQAAFSAFAPDKATWKELPGSRYTAAELRAMHEHWSDVEIIIPTEPVCDAD